MKDAKLPVTVSSDVPLSRTVKVIKERHTGGKVFDGSMLRGLPGTPSGTTQACLILGQGRITEVKTAEMGQLKV